MPEARIASRLGVSKCVTSPADNRSRLSKLATRSRNSCEAASIIRAGISSHPISSRKSGMPSNHQVSQSKPRVTVTCITYTLWKLRSNRGEAFPRGFSRLLHGFRLFALLRYFALLLIHPRLRDPNRQRPHSRNHSDAFSHRDGPPSIQNVEQMRAL